MKEQAESDTEKSLEQGRVGLFLESIKFSHSIFALPFALSAFFMAGTGSPAWPLLGKGVAACETGLICASDSLTCQPDPNG